MADQRSGDDAIARLVVEHHEAVYRYAYRLTGSHHDAEDLTQDVFLAAQRNFGQLRNRAAAKSWLFVILRNRFLKSRPRQRPTTAADLELDVGDIPDAPATEAPDGERLQAALNRLPEAFRLAVVMYYFEECSYREIAEELGVPLGTVMSRLARAKDRLRGLLDESAAATKKNPPNQRGPA